MPHRGTGNTTFRGVAFYELLSNVKGESPVGKALADPLFMFLAGVIVLQLSLYRNWSRIRGRGRFGLLLLTALTGALWLLGTHEVESRLIERLNRIHPVPSPETVADIDVVIVLSGGYVDAPDGTYDQLDHWSTARVRQGVRTYFESGARLLIVTGRGGPVSAVATGGDSSGAGGDSEREQSGGDANGGSGPERVARGMKRFAVELGVPPERVVEEPFARTTREHPIELIRLNVVGPEDTIGVVTSSWHLPRAMIEFGKHFPRTVAVPAFDTAIHRKTGLLRWMPRSLSLANSATAVTEHIGILWYRMPFAGKRLLTATRRPAPLTKPSP